MKNTEIKGLNAEQIQQSIKEEQNRLLRLKFAHAVSPIENPMRIRNSRRLIARLMTELTVKSKAA
jgi:large subunit ribosomal protein L29